MVVKNLTRNNIVLLVCLLIMILLYPLLTSTIGLLQELLMTAVLFSGIFSLNFSSRSLRILLPLGGLTVATIWINLVFPGYVISLIDFISTVLFLIAIVVLMIRHIAQSKHVTATIILSSINCYFLLGLLGGVLLIISDLVYRYLHSSDQHAIDFAHKHAPEFYDYVYFSFVTLTTLGYGDVTPISHLARSISILIALSGQMYMTILIALLVGKFLARSREG
jgi:voltage-gated potassium channel